LHKVSLHTIVNRSVGEVMTFTLVKYHIKLSVVVTTVADVVDLTVALLKSMLV